MQKCFYQFLVSKSTLTGKLAFLAHLLLSQVHASVWPITPLKVSFFNHW